MTIWSFSEYVLHRFLFHSEDYWLPNHYIAIANHFLLHGIHHAFPMDRYRLVFPVLPGYIILGLLIGVPIHLVFPENMAPGLMVGLIVGYIVYDLIHYFLHHSSPRDGYWKMMKVHHMQHHYKNGLNGFGVSSKFWDLVF